MAKTIPQESSRRFDRIRSVVLFSILFSMMVVLGGIGVAIFCYYRSRGLI